uniref:Uncharacterized protein n=1 Tax=Ananas comosus var. bracteatus TaxID=296719 RepID=A0A6V7PKW5_ANACO|nr:unnamed protein product [Ananas comosus var. bracteatus]
MAQGEPGGGRQTRGARKGFVGEDLGVEEGPTIFKHERKAGDEELLKVRVVAIGPYHRNSSSPMRFDDDYKWKITRFMVNKLGVDMKKYLNKMEKKGQDARRCYSEGLSEWSSREFRTMLLLDSSFILFVMDASRYSLLDLGTRFMDSVDLQLDRSTFMEYMALSLDVREHLKQIKLDLLTVDNQIPFSAIKTLLNCFGEEGHKPSIEDLALSCFDDLWPTRNEEQKIDTDMPPFHHLLHLFHWSRIPAEGYEMNSRLLSNKNASQQYIPSATELQKSATKFKKNDSGSCLGITFKRRLTGLFGVIKIPVLHLYDYSKSTFRNLIAFEANPTNDVLCFTAYSACMSCILQRKEDVKLLMERGILASTNYKDTEVIEFFKDLSRKVEDSIMPDTLIELYNEVNGHHNNKISKWFGNFRLHYFPNPWITLSLIGALVLFALSFFQTIYGMLSYYHPPE